MQYLENLADGGIYVISLKVEMEKHYVPKLEQHTCPSVHETIMNTQRMIP